MGRKITFERHEKTHAAIGRLRRLNKGEEVSYAELASIIGCEPQLEGYGYVSSARDILTREGYVFDIVAGIGIRRLTDPEIAASGKRRKRIRTQARRNLREKSNAILSALSQAQQAAVTSDLAITGTILHFTDIRFAEAQQQQLSKNAMPSAPPPIQG